MVWQECKDLEKDIILSISKKPKSLTEISKEIKRTKPTISTTIKRLAKQQVVIKNLEILKDARKLKISINPKRVRIHRTHTFYLIYFTLSFISFIVSLILSFIFKQFFLLLGCSFGILPALLYILYEVYIKEDKIIVEKKPKILKREKELVEQAEPQKLLEGTN